MPPQSVLPLGIAVSSFLIDLKIPNDVPDAFLYVLAVLSCAWVPCPNAAFYTALGLTLFVVLGSLASPPISPATRVLIECREAARGIRVTISDDGQGIDSDARLKPDSLGLLGLHERLTAVGGELEISNVEPHGVRVDALFPIR